MDPLTDFDEKVAEGLRLLQDSEDKPPFWATEEARFNLRKAKGHFFDVTETYRLEQSLKTALLEAGDGAVVYPEISFFSMDAGGPPPSISIEKMNIHVETLTKFHNRYYQSDSGKEASNEIHKILSQLAQGKPGVTITRFSHSWPQESIIARIPGSSNKKPVVILGAHLDSINSAQWPPRDARAPGADDNATGVACLLEIFRVLISIDFRPQRDVEFHFYAAEEVGLLGSQAVASKYRSEGRDVYGMLNLDMSGYVKPGTQPTIALITDYTNANLTNVVRQLVKQYSHLPPTDIVCHYACSDHASWNKNKYPSAFIFESLFENHNPNIHTAEDTTEVEGFTWKHVVEFAKVGLMFAHHLGSG